MGERQRGGAGVPSYGGRPRGWAALRGAGPFLQVRGGLLSAHDLLAAARAHELKGQLKAASGCYEEAAALASGCGDGQLHAEALRRLGVTRHRLGDRFDGRRLAERSHEVARTGGFAVLAAEALNCLAGFDIESASYDSARARFLEALDLGRESAPLRGRIEQNLGILANIRGDLDDALLHYREALAAFERAGDRRGAAIVHHNLGMINADRGEWAESEQCYRRSIELATELGDVELRALCLLNQTEVLLARQQYADARASAEAALVIFDELGSNDGKAAAYRFLGTLYRETGEPALAEARLRQSIDLARDGSFPLEEAETLRELALLFMATGRNQEALRALDHAKRLFRRLEANLDLSDVATRSARLETTYLEVVRSWGQSIESADRYTFGHCERVATYAVSVAQALGLGEIERTTIRVGAYLHDVGKMKVPHEILNKPGRLDPDEFALMQQHPIYGVELLAAIEFPWDIRPIIRWHHERADGKGYPDGLVGEEIPLPAQIIGIVDVWDALTTDRPYRPAMSHAEAMAQMEQCREHWRGAVYDAFCRAVGSVKRGA